jgi:hypothetical protein
MGRCRRERDHPTQKRPAEKHVDDRNRTGLMVLPATGDERREEVQEDDPDEHSYSSEGAQPGRQFAQRRDPDEWERRHGEAHQHQR